ncbi:MAG: Asp-tRNA(Asn)/Glu-tRNA(Gln) amidotransferase subunit GatA [Simkaniaceae bacterium]|nr:Asp-tRNA(Asn)/Glu-tRNA(Gln) amidotransferase subunit GatA [Simkaniaceae bacterium]
MYRKTAIELSEDFKSGKTTARHIAEYFLKRIRSGDAKIGSCLTVLEERVLSKADELDRKRAQNKSLGKLAGIPITIKDNMHIQGVKTTCASKILENYEAPFDATVTRLIEEEDGLILAKTNLDEFAMGSTNEYSAFYPVNNPWNSNISPGGSSGGSAASVSACFAKLSLGSDTGGSIRLPASFTGIVGFKPSYGRVSRYGLVAFGSSLDQVGPFGKSVKDVALAMEVIGRHCRYDSTSFDAPQENYLDELDLSIQGKTIGIPHSLIDLMADEPRKHFENNIALLKSLGLTVIDINLDILKYCVPVYYIIAPAEASTNLARYDGVLFSKRAKNIDSIESLYNKSREMGFGAEVKQRILLGTYVLSSGQKDAYYNKAQQVRTLIIKAFKNAFEKCDMIAMPTVSHAAFDKGALQDSLSLYLQDIYTIPANLAGLPAISVPSGFTTDQRPLSLQLIGPYKEDARVLRFAHHFEKAAHFSPDIAPAFDKEEIS